MKQNAKHSAFAVQTASKYLNIFFLKESLADELRNRKYLLLQNGITILPGEKRNEK